PPKPLLLPGALLLRPIHVPFLAFLRQRDPRDRFGGRAVGNTLFLLHGETSVARGADVVTARSATAATIATVAPVRNAARAPNRFQRSPKRTDAGSAEIPITPWKIP